jgi:hypothetical protein
MGQPNFPSIGEAVIVPVGRDAMRKLDIIRNGGSESLGPYELLAVAEEIAELRLTVRFFASAIKCGEQWSPECQMAYDRAFSSSQK